MKRLHAALLVCALIILAVAGRLLLAERAQRVSARAEMEYERTAKRDLLALMLAYPAHIEGVQFGEDGLLYVVMESGVRIPYDDMKQKSFDEQLCGADLQDMMALPYPLETIGTLREGSDDPGRVRCYAFLHAIYGDTKHEIEQNLVSASLVSGRFPVAAEAAPALEAAMASLAAYVRDNPSAHGYVFPLNGTYNYRFIAGTSMLSPHAFGIAVDFCSNPCDYWRWATRKQGQSRLDDYPMEVVNIMENHGFIWGGKWAHFDFLHFEYRPELILKARYASDEKQPWYALFPEDKRTQGCIEIIDAAFS
jgi:hypothetical protein